jgi:mannose-1-phosphate guanylyltransferase
VKAVVLVGGFGTRLRPLTLDTPKQMLPVVDRPMIEWVMGHLAGHGVTDAVLSLGYRPDDFRDRYRDGRCAGVRLHYAVEPEPLDTAGAIRFAALDGGVDERFVVVNGDVLTDFDVSALWDFHDAAGAEGTIHLTPVDDPSRYGVVPVRPDGSVIEFVEKPPIDEAPSHWVNAGTYVLEPSVLGRIPDGRKVSIERETFPEMAAEGTLYALQDDAYWIDTGTPATYIQAQLDLVDGTRGDGLPPVHPTAEVAASSSVTRSVVMEGVRVAGDATVCGSIVLPDAVVGERAAVSDSIVGRRARVGTGATLAEGTIVGLDAVVDDGAHLSGARIPESS